MQDLHVETGRFREALERLSAGLAQAGMAALRVGVTAAEASARTTSAFHDRTGGTRGSIRGEVTGPSGGFVRAGGAARLLQSGTAAHRIAATGTALRFVVNGRTLYRAAVQHPGTAPRPFMTEARDAGERAIREALPVIIGDAIRQAR